MGQAELEEDHDEQHDQHQGVAMSRREVTEAQARILPPAHLVRAGRGHSCCCPCCDPTLFPAYTNASVPR